MPLLPPVETLYLENFRGFKKALIPLTQVTIFVGENSTGKTSVLNLLRLFSSQEFWFQNKFSAYFSGSGHFEDLVSAHSSDRSFFRVGLVKQLESLANDEAQEAGAILLSYRNAEGTPRLSHVSILLGVDEFHFRFDVDGLMFKHTTLKHVPATVDIQVKVLPRWSREHKIPDGLFTKVSTPSRLESESLLQFVIALSILPEAESTKKAKLSSRIFSLLPGFQSSIAWIAPIRTKPKRTYDEFLSEFSPEGSHTPYTIRKLLSSREAAQRFSRSLEEVGRATGLFESVQIKRFGKGVSAPFEVDVVIDGKALGISNVGYGVSQSLPFIVEMVSRPPRTWLAIEQPEVHLHPRAQAALGEALFKLASVEEKGFLIETHSDFILDRFRAQYRSTADTAENPNAHILFFERRGKCNTVTCLEIDTNGDLPTEQPDSYRSFFIREQMHNLGF